MINKIQLSENTAFKAKYIPCTHHNGCQRILEQFEKRTSEFPNYELYQEFHSYGGDDFFRLYEGDKLVSFEWWPLTSQKLNSIDESVDAIYFIFNKLLNKIKQI